MFNIDKYWIRYGQKIKGEIEEYVEKHFVQINTHSYSVCGVLFLYMYSKKMIIIARQKMKAFLLSNWVAPSTYIFTYLIKTANTTEKFFYAYHKCISNKTKNRAAEAKTKLSTKMSAIPERSTAPHLTFRVIYLIVSELHSKPIFCCSILQTACHPWYNRITSTILRLGQIRTPFQL